MAIKRKKYKNKKREFFEYVQEYGIWGVDKAKFSKEFDVSTKALNTWIEEFRLSDEHLKDAQINLGVAFKASIQRMIYVLSNPETSDVKAERFALTLARVSKFYIDYLERFGYKHLSVTDVGYTLPEEDVLAKAYLQAYGHAAEKPAVIEVDTES